MTDTSHQGVVEAVIEAWDKLPSGRHTPDTVNRWLCDVMKPAIDAARALPASFAGEREGFVMVPKVPPLGWLKRAKQLFGCDPVQARLAWSAVLSASQTESTDNAGGGR